MESVTSSPEMERMFVVGTHHRRLSVLYINHNSVLQGEAQSYHQPQHSRTGVNEKPEGRVAVAVPGPTSFMGKSKFLMESYKDATSQPYGYLVLDFSPSAEEEYRVRTRIFPDEDTVVYQSI